MPVFALPGDYGTGTFGKESYDFIDFLVKSNHYVWQVLPLGQTSFGDSPYQTVSDKSLNPYYCNLEDLYKQNLITVNELENEKRKVTKVNYAALYNRRYALLKKAYSRFTPTDEFLSFVNKKEFYDYAVFMTLKSVYGSRENFNSAKNPPSTNSSPNVTTKFYSTNLFSLSLKNNTQNSALTRKKRA